MLTCGGEKVLVLAAVQVADGEDSRVQALYAKAFITKWTGDISVKGFNFFFIFLLLLICIGCRAAVIFRISSILPRLPLSGALVSRRLSRRRSCRQRLQRYPH